MRKLTIGMLLLLSLFIGSAVTAQAPTAQAPTDATDITTAQISDFFKTAPPDRNSDRFIRVLDLGGYRVGVSGVWRPKVAPPTPIIHQTRVAEVYYMLSGSGMLKTGGTLVPPLQSSKSFGDWTDVRGTAIDGGVVRHVGPGDVVVIPGGVAHQWLSVDGDNVSYLIFRTDPDKALQLK